MAQERDAWGQSWLKILGSVSLKDRFGYSNNQDANPSDGFQDGLPVYISKDVWTPRTRKYPVYPWSFGPMHQAPGTCQVRHAVDQDASSSGDLSSLWRQKSRNLDRASRSQDPGDTRSSDECAATKSSMWRSSIQEPSHSEQAHEFRAEKTAEDPDSKKY
ncbi:unnamed protein product [Phytophthora fragariaefolia]|uniref:Unnamed protein product n=1 Tax=Phytophthora fragariaefolia TaxID=1490495 RepID=A0A9W6XV70_9STRA|nr:unnamed protein product [Phytophthora fragariaefolia]